MRKKGEELYLRSLDEAFAAVLTHVGSFLSVDPEVSFEISSTDEPLATPAVLADVGSFFCVGPHVNLG